MFAVGVLLIEAWTGYPPFRRATAQESEHALFKVPAPIDRQLPLLAPLSALIASSVALDARDRPVAAEHLARPLREFLKSEDSGDIARRLGERVRRARRRSRSSNPWLPGESVTSETSQNTRPLNSEPPLDGARALPSSAPGSAPVTRTFAARDEVEVWTRKLSSAPAPLPETPRAIPTPRLPAPVAVAPQVAPIDDHGREPSGISSSKSSRAPNGNAGLALLAIASVGFVALAFALGPRNERPRAPAAASATISSVPSAPSTPSAQEALPAPTPTSSQSAPASRSPLQRSADSPRPRASASAAPAPPEQFGVLKITADPGADVVVTGPHFQQAGHSPILGLKLPIGKYRIAFRNDTFGAALGAEVMVVAGVSRSVHADFRQAEPAVSVR